MPQPMPLGQDSFTNLPSVAAVLGIPLWPRQLPHSRSACLTIPKSIVTLPLGEDVLTVALGTRVAPIGPGTL